MKKHDIKKLLVTAMLCIAAAGAYAQNGFNMPFSQFGIGSSEQPYNLPMVTRMGGVLYTLSGNNYINPFNPASYGAIESESFVFDMGVGVQMSTLRDRSNHQDDADGNVAYLLIGMPVTKWWKLAAGLMPYSTVNYESTSTITDPVVGTVKNIYDGNGGVNQVFLGSSFNILRGDAKSPSLQVGFNVNYLTGRIQRAISYSFPDTASHCTNSRRLKETQLGNVTVDFGLQMRQPLGERYTLGLGLVYKPYFELKVNEMALIYTYDASDESLIDTIFPARGNDASFKSTMEQGQTFGVGLSLERNKKWQVAVDATFASWQGMKYTEGQQPSVFGTSAISYGPYSRYAIGYEKLGDMDASTYWGRMSWSFGVHAEQGALRLNLGGTEHRIDEWGAGTGITLPMRKGRSLLILSLGYSSFGVPNVLQRNTWTFGVAVSSCERWFFKRKYN